MKKNILAIIICFAACCTAQAQQVVEDNFERLRVTFSTGALQTGKTILDGHEFTRLSIDGMLPSSQAGAPELPVWSAMIEVPMCKGYVIEVTDAEYDTLALAGAKVVPAQPSRSKSDREVRQMVRDGKVYATDAFFSVAPLASVEEVGVARDRTLARLQFSPVSYNPAKGLVAVCRKATVTVHYEGADMGASMSLYDRYNSPAFDCGPTTLNTLYANTRPSIDGAKAVRTTAPVRYLIVAHSMFRGQMDTFVQWKRRKGFITDIVYTDDAGVGTTSESIAAYVKSQYDNATAASPAPTYLLLVGDHEQIPAFSAQVTSPSSDHITDLYYVSWTSGDHLPDCYVGRFSAQNVSQLTPQIEKTLMYEQYTFADPSFLDRAVMVAGIDNGSSGDYGYTHADPAMDYAITNYVNGAHGFSQVTYLKNNTSIVPTASNVTIYATGSSGASTALSAYNAGAGWINYSAHGSATGWYSPSFSTSSAASMTNRQKFGIMIGNCCLTNKFETETCLGEAVLRKGDYCGAMGYIGGSNSTYWNEDVYWAVGVRNSISPTMSMAYDGNNLGVYDRLFHTHGEAQSGWATSQGSIVMMGNMSVESSSTNSSMKHYYWEIYHLMGDPSVMPYLTQAQDMALTVSPVLMLGVGTLSVTAAPYAYVALTDTLTRTLWAAAYADASGHATLSLPSGMQVGGYELAASAQQYKTAFSTVSVVPSAGPYAMVVGIEPTASFNAGTTVPLRIAVANLGNSNASGIAVTLASDNPTVTLSATTLNVGSIAAGDTVVVTTVSATAAQQATDGTRAMVTATTGWSGSSTPTSVAHTLTVNAPALAMTVTPTATVMLPNSSMTVAIDLVNNGHATQGTSQLSITAGNPLMTVTTTGGNFTLAAGGTLHRQFQLHAATNIDTDIFVPVYVKVLRNQGIVVSDTLQIYIGENSTETFEGGQFQLTGWQQGSFPWTVTSDQSAEGSWSARSAENLGSNNSSTMSITFTTAAADSVSFYYRVSSEANYDKFYCRLDGVEMLEASGEVDWTRAAFAVASGSHQLEFSYTKDYSVDRNSDCAWVDYIALPYGARVTSDGGNDEPGDDDGEFENLIATFESADDDSRWTLASGGLTNVWTIGTAASNGSSRGLYISDDGGLSNNYTISTSASVFAYTRLWLDAGDYVSSFDWRCNGESSYDYLRAALIPGSTTLAASSSAASGWSTNTLPSGAIAIDGGQKLNQSASWQTKTTEVHISNGGWYNLVFYWRNDNSMGDTPPAAVDNITLLRAGDVHTVTVTASHGVTTGSGNYQTGEVATVGVYPEAGYTFVGWSDGNTSNPRQLTVTDDLTLVATLTQGNVVVQHDTTVITQIEYRTIHDTTVITQTEYLTIHDTLTVTNTIVDTVTETVTVVDTITETVHDTTFVEVPSEVHDTTIVTLTEYLTVHDTVTEMVHDTAYITVTTVDTVTLTVVDTLTIVDTVTEVVRDTAYLEVPYTVYDTTYIEVPTEVHDTTVITLTEYLTIHDTVNEVVTDTIIVNDITVDTVILTVTVVDTVTEVMHDTTFVEIPFEVHDTAYVEVHDTTYVEVHDTTYVEVPFEMHDTAYVIVNDTLVVTETVVDTVTVVETITDTVTVVEQVIFVDTLTITDTITFVETITDTVTLVTHDTTYVDVPYEVHDTTFVTLTDTITTVVFDTVTNTVHDTTTSIVYDTTVVTDTLWLVEHDTVWLTDTIFIHDTIYVTEEGIDGVETINVTVYSSGGQVVVDGADGHMVTLYDINGRVLATRRDDRSPLRFDVPASGTYLIRVAGCPARRVVVVR